MLPAAANSVQTPAFPKHWPAILPAAEVFKSLVGRLFLAKIPYDRKGMMSLAQGQTGKESMGELGKANRMHTTRTSGV